MAERDLPGDPFEAWEPDAIEYSQRLKELGERYAETKDPSLRRVLYEELAGMREIISELEGEEEDE